MPTSKVQGKKRERGSVHFKLDELLQGLDRRRDTHVKDFRNKIVLIGSQVYTHFSICKALYLQRSYCEEMEGICLYMVEPGLESKTSILIMPKSFKSCLRGFLFGPEPTQFSVAKGAVPYSLPLSEPFSALC